jgi:hypothetical protein
LENFFNFYLDFFGCLTFVFTLYDNLLQHDKLRKETNFCANRQDFSVELTKRQTKFNKLKPLTRAYFHLLADVHLAGFAPAFTLSFHDSECYRKLPITHSTSTLAVIEKNRNDIEKQK